jgi:hypothetical protein
MCSMQPGGSACSQIGGWVVAARVFLRRWYLKGPFPSTRPVKLKYGVVNEVREKSTEVGGQ